LCLLLVDWIERHSTRIPEWYLGAVLCGDIGDGVGGIPAWREGNLGWDYVRRRATGRALVGGEDLNPEAFMEREGIRP